MPQPLTVAAARQSLAQAGFPVQFLGEGTLRFWILQEHCDLEEVFLRAGWHKHCRECAERAETKTKAERARVRSHEQKESR